MEIEGLIFFLFSWFLSIIIIFFFFIFFFYINVLIFFILLKMGLTYVVSLEISKFG